MPIEKSCFVQIWNVLYSFQSPFDAAYFADIDKRLANASTVIYNRVPKCGSSAIRQSFKGSICLLNVLYSFQSLYDAAYFADLDQRMANANTVIYNRVPKCGSAAMRAILQKLNRTTHLFRLHMSKTYNITRLSKNQTRYDQSSVLHFLSRRLCLTQQWADIGAII